MLVAFRMCAESKLCLAQYFGRHWQSYRTYSLEHLVYLVSRQCSWKFPGIGSRCLPESKHQDRVRGVRRILCRGGVRGSRHGVALAGLEVESSGDLPPVHLSRDL
jgi:hypothetical protein